MIRGLNGGCHLSAFRGATLFTMTREALVHKESPVSPYNLKYLQATVFGREGDGRYLLNLTEVRQRPVVGLAAKLLIKSGLPRQGSVEGLIDFCTSRDGQRPITDIRELLTSSKARELLLERLDEEFPVIVPQNNISGIILNTPPGITG